MDLNEIEKHENAIMSAILNYDADSPCWGDVDDDFRYFCVDSNGDSHHFTNKPSIYGEGGWAVCNSKGEILELGEFWGEGHDASDWENSLKDRPQK
jgi:hypothetical protein